MKPWVDIFFKVIQTALLAYAIFSGKDVVIQLSKHREAPHTMQAMPGFPVPDLIRNDSMNPWVLNSGGSQRGP
jgi:hypothetical protein